jgi:hypothetical protein
MKPITSLLKSKEEVDTMKTIETESSEIQHRNKFEIISHRSMREKMYLKDKNKNVENADLDLVIISDQLTETPPKMVIR